MVAWNLNARHILAQTHTHTHRRVYVYIPHGRVWPTSKWARCKLFLERKKHTKKEEATVVEPGRIYYWR